MAMSNVQQDWQWSDQFIPAIKSIVGPYLLETATLTVDRNKATDLVVMRAKNLMIACRVRRAKYNKPEYRNQFTIRSGRSSGSLTELDKIIDGFGDWMFYGFESVSTPGSIDSWHLIDLVALRSHMIRNPSAFNHGERTNGDGTAFHWFDLATFPARPAIMIGKSGGG